MAKSKSFLSGVSKEFRSKITALRNEGRKAAAACCQDVDAVA